MRGLKGTYCSIKNLIQMFFLAVAGNIPNMNVYYRVGSVKKSWQNQLTASAAIQDTVL